MLKAFRTPENKTLQLDKWLKQNRKTVEAVASMRADDDGTRVYILKFTDVFKPREIPGFGVDVLPVPLPNVNIEVKDFGELTDITEGKFEGSIGAEYIKDFIEDILKSGRPVVVKTSEDNQRYLLYFTKDHLIRYASMANA